MARVTIDVDLPPGVKITSYDRFQDGHGFEVSWPLPERCRCEKCGHEERAQIEFKATPQAIRDLPVWDQPSFWIYQAPFHRCGRCNYRQHIIPPFKRKDVAYTYRFEQFVLRSLIGSTAEDVARRLGISAETVERIVEYQLAEQRQIDPQRVITDVGLDELSLKKRHRLYVTLMTDLSDPVRPQILAVAKGKDTVAAQKCLDLLSEEQRQQVRTHRVDMGSAYPSACAVWLKNSRAVTDRFHVAKKFNEVVDTQRKKNHPRRQGETDQGRAQDVSHADVGVPPRSEELDGQGAARVGGSVREDPEAEGVVPRPSPVQGDLRHGAQPHHRRALVAGSPP
jgi:transposase